MRVRIRALPRALRGFLVVAVVYWLAGAATLIYQAVRTLSADLPVLQTAAAVTGIVCGAILFIGTLISLRDARAQRPTRWLGAAPIVVLSVADMFTSDFTKTGAWFWFTSGVLAWALIELLSTHRRETLTPASGVPRVDRPAVRM
ncbi:MAG TPA: hypothetical protein VF039_14660 [Longimicrobiales bacterium]